MPAKSSSPRGTPLATHEPQPLSAHQRADIRAAARRRWMLSRDIERAASAAQLVVCGFVGADQIAEAHQFVRSLIIHWSENAIANPDVSPMRGEPGRDLKAEGGEA